MELSIIIFPCLPFCPRQWFLTLILEPNRALLSRAEVSYWLVAQLLQTPSILGRSLPAASEQSHH